MMLLMAGEFFPVWIKRVLKPTVVDQGPHPACNICGGAAFAAGPAGRAAVNGRAPRCLGCESLERHRLNRLLFQALPIGALAWRRALQFSPDIALVPAWFRSFEVSVYGGENSLDLQRSDRPDAAYDLVSLSHVLEFVPDDYASMTELIRVLSPQGVLHLVLSAPLIRERSEDHATAQGVHQYFHLYGRDFAKRFALRERGLEMLVVRVSDPVTDTAEAVHLLSKSSAVFQGLRAALELAAACGKSLYGHQGVGIEIVG